MPGKGYQIAASGKETRIRRGDMRTLSQVWLTFMLANVVPIGHVSDINVARSNLLFSMIQDDYTINVARIISDEIQRTVDWERVRGAERLGTLGFPTLITGLCAENGIIVELRAKIRTSIDKKFIDHHCTNLEERPKQRNQVPSPPASMFEPTLEAVEKKLMRHILHLEEEQSTLCRFMLQMYHAMRDNAYMDDEELSSYLNWPGDRPSSVEREDDCHEAQSTAGVEKNEEAEKKMEATAEVAEEAEATAEVAKDKIENVVANVEETITGIGAEEVAKEVAETAEENANANTKESGENVIAEVFAKKKDHPGPLRRSFRIKTAVIKKGLSTKVQQYLM